MLRSIRNLSIPAFFFAPAVALAQTPPATQTETPPVSPAAPAVAPADAPPPTQPVPRVHDGFYFSGSAGGGARSMFINGSDDVNVDGTGAAVSFRVGGAIAPNLFLHATVGSSLTTDPEISVGAMTATANGAEVSFVSVGPGLTYYFMPANVALGGSAVVMQTSLALDGDVLSKSEWGPGLELRIGKEFWIADHMLFGASLTGAAAVMSDQNTTDKIVAQSFNLMLDFTYD